MLLSSWLLLLLKKDINYIIIDPVKPRPSQKKPGPDPVKTWPRRTDSRTQPSDPGQPRPSPVSGRRPAQALTVSQTGNDSDPDQTGRQPGRTAVIEDGPGQTGQLTKDEGLMAQTQASYWWPLNDPREGPASQLKAGRADSWMTENIDVTIDCEPRKTDEAQASEDPAQLVNDN